MLHGDILLEKIVISILIGRHQNIIWPVFEVSIEVAEAAF